MEPVRLNDQKLPPSSEEKEEIKPVIKGRVVQKKSRFTRIQKEASEIGSHIIEEILLPTFKNMLYSTAQEAAGRALFGDNYVHRQSPTPGGGKPYVSYNRVSASPVRDVRARRTHAMDDIVLETRGEAEDVLDALDERIRRYRTASVADLYDMLGIKSNYTDQSWGWTHMRGATTRRVTNGYILDLPKIEPIQ